MLVPKGGEKNIHAHIHNHASDAIGKPLIPYYGSNQVAGLIDEGSSRFKYKEGKPVRRKARIKQGRGDCIGVSVYRRVRVYPRGILIMEGVL